MNWQNRIYESLVQDNEAIDEISVAYAAKIAGGVEGKAQANVNYAKQARQRQEIQDNPGGHFETEPAAQTRGTPSKAETAAGAHKSAKQQQAYRINRRLAARVAAAGAGKGKPGDGIEGREGQKSIKKFQSIAHKERRKTTGKEQRQGVLSRLASRFRSTTKSPSQRKTSTAHGEHFKGDPSTLMIRRSKKK